MNAHSAVAEPLRHMFRAGMANSKEIPVVLRDLGVLPGPRKERISRHSAIRSADHIVRKTS
jgi:hypothetical protein